MRIPGQLKAVFALVILLAWGLLNSASGGTPRRPMLSELAATGELTFHVLTQGAERIVTGTVRQLHSYYDPDSTTIYTDVTISNGEVLKGDKNSSVTFTVPGGRVGECFLWVSHFPTFTLGEEVLVFLRTYNRGVMYPIGDLVLSGDDFGAYRLSRVTAEDSAASNTLIDHVRRIVSGETVEPIRIGGNHVSYPLPERRTSGAAGKILATPSISSVSDVDLDWDPNHANHPLADTLVISGSNFDNNPTSNHKVRYTIWYNNQLTTTDRAGTDEAIFSWTNTQIKMRLDNNYTTSGNIKVYTPSGGWSAPAQYNVRFNTKRVSGGHHYYWSNAAASNGIRYYFNYSTYADTGPTGTVTDVMWTGEDWHWADTLGVDKGYDAWQDVANSNIVFIDGGNSPHIEWNHADGYNVVIWQDFSTDAGAYAYAVGAADTILECDIGFNYMLSSGEMVDTLFWSTKAGEVGSQGGPPTDNNHPWRDDPKDIWDVMSHEVGHCVGLDHGYGAPDTLKTMYYTSDRRDTLRRTLTSDDAAGVQWLYYSAGKPTTIGTTRSLVPNQIYLEQNYPNPFNPQTYIRFHLLEPARVTLKIYDTLGQEVRTLVSQEQRGSGDYHILWDSKDNNGMLVASGVYICQLATEISSITAKMTLLR